MVAGVGFHTIGVLLVAGIVLYAPGVLVIVASGVRMPFRWGLAPVVTAGVFAVLAVAFHVLGIRWGLVPAAVGSGVVVAATWLLARRLRERLPGSLPVGIDRPTWRQDAVVGVAVVLAALVVLIPVYRASPGLNSFNNSFDSLFHYNAVRTVRDVGDAFPLTGLRTMFGDTSTFYPMMFHQVAALVPGPLVRATNATALVILVSSAGALATLLAVAIPRRIAPWHRTVATALVVPSAFVFFSLPFMVLTVGLWPNAFGMAVLPALTAIIIVAVRRIPAAREAGAGMPVVVAMGAFPLLLVAVGVVFIHPSMGFSVAVLVFSLWVAGCIVLWRSGHHRRIAIIGAVIALVVLTVSDVLGATVLRSMAQTVKPDLGPLQVVLSIVADRPRLTSIPMKTQFVLPVLGLAIVGAVGALRRRDLESIFVLVLTAATFVLCLGAMIPFLPISSLANPWFQARERIFPMFTTMMLVLAAVGLADLLSRYARRRTATVLVATAVGVAVLLTPPVLTTTDWQRMPRLASVSLNRDGYLVPYVAPAEAAFIQRAARQLPEDAVVLGTPADGTTAFYALGDRRLVFMHGGYPSTAQQLRIGRDGNLMFTDPRVCRAVRGYGPDLYLYQDESRFSGHLVMNEAQQRSFSGVEDIDASHLPLVAESPDGDYRLYRLDLPC